MKILFIYTDINSMNQGARSYSFGISILSAVLKRCGHQTSLYYMYNKYNIKPFLKKVSDFKPDVLALTSDSTQYVYVKRIIERVKDYKIFTVLGGVHASLYPHCLMEIEGLDAVCRGEGEFALLDLVESFKNNKNIFNIKSLNIKESDGTIRENSTRPLISDLDSLPFGDRNIFNYQKVIDSEFGRASFILSRGCPYNCTFCASPAMGKLQEGKFVRFMSVERAIAELEWLKRKYLIKTLMFTDDVFTLDKEYIFKFCERYRDKIAIPYEVNARVECAELGLFKALKESGCFKVHMGIESGDEKFRSEVLNRHMSNEQIVGAFAMAKKAGLLTKSYNMVGFPFETKELHNSTIDLNCRIMPDGNMCTIFQPYPGTKLFEVCQDQKFIDKEVFNKELPSRRDTLLRMPGFPREQIIRCHKRFSFEVYKKYSLRRAFFYRLYYLDCAEFLLRILNPLKGFLRKIAMR